MQWSRTLGLPESPLSFQDLFSLDEEFLQFIPKPVKAVLLLFPSRGELAQAREQEEKDGQGVWNGDGVWWIKQTVNSSRNLSASRRQRLTTESCPDTQRLRFDWPASCLAEPTSKGSLLASDRFAFDEVQSRKSTSPS